MTDFVHRSSGQRRAVMGGSPHKRRHERGHADVSVLRNKERRAHAAGERRLEAAGVSTVDIGVSRSGLSERLPFPLELLRLDVVAGNLKGTRAPILDCLPRVRADAGNEAVVMIQTAEAEPQKRRHMSFDVRSQDAG